MADTEVVTSLEFATRIGRITVTNEIPAANWTDAEAETVDAMIADVVAMVEAYLFPRGMTILAAGYTDMSIAARRSPILWVGHCHINSVTNIKDADGTEIADTDYRIAPCGCFIQRKNNALWSDGKGDYNYTITFNAGWTTVPADLKSIVLDILVKRWSVFDKQGVSSARVGDVSYTYDKTSEALEKSIRQRLLKYKCRQII